MACSLQGSSHYCLLQLSLLLLFLYTPSNIHLPIASTSLVDIHLPINSFPFSHPRTKSQILSLLVLSSSSSLSLSFFFFSFIFFIFSHYDKKKKQ